MILPTPTQMKSKICLLMLVITALLFALANEHQVFTITDLQISDRTRRLQRRSKQTYGHEVHVKKKQRNTQLIPYKERRVEDPSDHYFCGIGFADASESCAYPCPSGSRSECPKGYLCYFDTPCDRNNLPPTTTTGTADTSATLVTEQGESSEQSPAVQPTKQTPKPTKPLPPTQAPWAENDPRLSLFCGKDWGDASNTCQVWCPDGSDDACPYGQLCFSDTNCKYTRPPTNKPTPPKPSRSPTARPTGPTTSPTIGPLLESPTNHMFCATSIMKVAEQCSLETHCPNGQSDCKLGTFCWTNVMECDVREFIPWVEGGLLGKPESATSGMTDKEISQSLGFTWPSLKESDHYFCGTSLEDANFRCGVPCPDGTAVGCNHGQLCFYDTECDARVHPEYYITDSPLPPFPPPTPNPNSYFDRENYAFCGLDWDEANSCSTKWCGFDMSCPEGKSCFADTECNVKDLPPMKPTRSPTWSPVTYDDEINNFFCGETYLDAVAKCSYETYCQTGKHSECGESQFCWPAVTCNVKDMVPETTARPTVDTAEPTKSPLAYDDPSTTRFCGFNWTDASSSCTDGRRPFWCPSGSDTECPEEGQLCFADTMCHISTAVFPPSESPTGSPTNYTSPAPTRSKPDHDDAIYTSFCGPTYLEASASCSIDSYCPGGVHTECPENQYCWAATTCNVHEFWPPPTPRPTDSPTIKNPPSSMPSGAPSFEPTGIPTHSPLAKDDPANFMYCGTDWLDASKRCRIKCPNQICPNGLACFSGTGCPRKPRDSPAPIDPDPTLAPTLLGTESTLSPTITSLSNNNPDVEDAPVLSSISPSSAFLSESPTLLEPEGTHIPTELNRDPAATSLTDQPSIIPTITPSVSPASIPTISPSGNLIIGRSNDPTLLTPSQISTVVPSSSPLQEKYTPQILSLPRVSKNTSPISPPKNIGIVQKILQNIAKVLDSEIFVAETRAGSVFKSTFFTFNGFYSAIMLYATNGINNDYFFLGNENTIQSGLVNIALFLAKVVTDAIAYESCDQSKLACGMWVLDTTFKETIFQCSDSSENAGLECLDASITCSCILGMLDKSIGSQSSSEFSYSSVNFCSPDPYESICSKYLEKGEDLRWLVPMSFWVSLVQRYPAHSGFVETYMSGLEKFVQNGIRESSFVEYVASISYIYESAEKAPIEKFQQNYLKIIDLLLSSLALLESEEPILSTPAPSESPTDSPLPMSLSPSERPTQQRFANNVGVLSLPTDIPIREPKTTSPPVNNNMCPSLCVVPIKTIECPSPGHKLKQCFGNLAFIGIDELCMAFYGECGTSQVSVNDCGRSYNVFRRIDCSTLVDLPHSEREEEFPSLELPALESPSSHPTSSILPTQNLEYLDSENLDLDLNASLPSKSPTTKPTSGFGGMVWWETVMSSSSVKNGSMKMACHLMLTFSGAISIIYLNS